ncbi:MAG: hypothetical protein FWD65_06130 [Coriobacteriia bacterium]|nr:hypothetical protein [Coriobacteriia bacterium]
MSLNLSQSLSRVTRVWASRASESGQASTEYVVALTLVIVVVLAAGGLLQYYRGGSEGSRPVARTLQGAPYTLGAPTSGGLQGVADVLMH